MFGGSPPEEKEEKGEESLGGVRSLLNVMIASLSLLRLGSFPSSRMRGGVPFYRIRGSSSFTKYGL